MTDFGVRCDTDELVSVLESLERQGASLSHLTPQIAHILVGAVERQFETEGEGHDKLAEHFGQSGWPPHAPSTLAKRLKKGGTPRLMQDTGVLAGSISPEHGDEFAVAYTNVPYIRYHLRGGPIIPKRNPFEIEEEHVLRETIDLLLAQVTT